MKEPLYSRKRTRRKGEDRDEIFIGQSVGATLISISVVIAAALTGFTAWNALEWVPVLFR